jgi:glycosyltransferase involved in cell wall biosynthesis
MSDSRAAHPAPIPLLKFVALFGCGGTERQFINLGLGLDAERFALEFGCLKRRGEFLQEIEARQIPVREYRLRSFFTLAALMQHLRLAWHIKRRGTHIVHAYNFYANLFAVPAAFLAGAPVIIASIRDRGAYLPPAQRRMQRLVCRFADCVLVNAEAIRDWLIEDGYDPRKIVIIRNGIDLSRFDAPKDPHLRASLGVPESAPLVTMLSRLTPVKGIEDFIAAAARLAPRYPEARFLIVGGGGVVRHGDIEEEDDGDRAKLEQMAYEAGLDGRVIFTGYRSDVPAILADTAVSVLPSHNEGLSNVLLESMAAGVPVVSTTVGGTPEIVEDSVTGFLVPPRAPAPLARAIGILHESPNHAAHMGRAARESVHARFSVDRMVQATAHLYSDLLARKAERPSWRGRLGLAPSPSRAFAERGPLASSRQV